MTIKEFEKRAGLQGGYDREFKEWKIIDIHEIPDFLEDGHEIDFYCSNGKQVYLLRLRNRAIKKLEIATDKTRFGYPTYLIAELAIEKIDNELLNTLLDEFTKLIR